MKFYITNHNINFIKKHYKHSFGKSNTYYFDFKKLVNDTQLVNYETNIYERFLLTSKIIESFKNATKNRKFDNIIYVIEKSKIDNSIMEGLKQTFKENSIYFTEYILIDNFHNIDTQVYKVVDEII